MRPVKKPVGGASRKMCCLFNNKYQSHYNIYRVRLRLCNTTSTRVDVIIIYFMHIGMRITSHRIKTTDQRVYARDAKAGCVHYIIYNMNM